MSGRDITVGVVNSLSSGVVRPVLLGYLDIKDDPISAWTGPGVLAPAGSDDAVLNGQTFMPLAPFVNLSDIAEDRGIGGPATLTVTGHELDSPILQQAIADKRTWRGRRAYLWLGLMNDDEFTVVADPFRIKAGVMTKMSINRTADKATVDVIIDRDLGNASAAPYRWVDHVRLWPGDKFSAFVTKLANKPQGFTQADVYSPGAGPRGRPRHPGDTWTRR